MKKAFIILFVIFILITGNVKAVENSENVGTDKITGECVNIEIPSKIEKEMTEAISKIYGKENADEIYKNVLEHARIAVENRSGELKKQDFEREADWYKKEIIYMFYVDKFGVVKNNEGNTFNDTRKMFDYLRDLGVTTLYLLPFAESPMKDAGFDVKNPREVRRTLGGMKEFELFMAEAKKYGFKIKSDLVLNHLSSEHEWFKRIEQGDKTALEYFVYKDKLPEYKKYVDEKLGTVIEYKEDNGKISKRRLIFPENTEHNYKKVTIDNKDYYLYHTFYPFQPDINWENPDVLYYMLDTISYWANMGTDIFRMDAIPYLSKEEGTNAENQPKTHAIIELLSNYIQLTAPSSVIQVEACQMPKDILKYFGSDRNVELNTIEGTKTLKRTSEAQIAYHFPLMNAIWASLISEDKKYFIDTYKKTPNIPESAAWSVFLRVHDELTLEMVSPEVRNLIFDDLVSKGASFRNGFGVSGRLANFLDRNPNRIECAYSILFSIPGIPIVYYGDEIGALNNFETAKKSAKLRLQNNLRSLLSPFDSRDINRGEIPRKLFYGSTKGYYEYNSKIYNKVKNLISLRKSLPVMSDGSFEILKTKNKSNFSYIRKNKEQQILVINNLSKEKLIAEITLPKDVILKKKGRIYSLKNLINGDNIRVNISLQNNTMRLRLAPYQVLWLELDGGIGNNGNDK